MTRVLTCVCWLLFGVLLNSCSDEVKPLTDLPHSWEVCDCNDVEIAGAYYNTFPFSDSIVAVAYQYIPSTGENARTVGLDTNGRFSEINMVKIDTLTREQVNQLAKIVVNRYEICHGEYDNSTDCMYTPHHCIVFYERDSIVAFLETCFLCTESLEWPKGTFGIQCGDFFDDMRYFYRSMGFADDALELETCPGYIPDTINIWRGHY